MRPALQSKNCVDVNYGKMIWSGTLAYKSTLEKQYFIVSEPKVEVISSKIDRMAAIFTSKFKWAWRAQFLSHTLQILEINLFFEAVKMVLLYLVKISFSFRNKKIGNKFSLHL